MFTLDAGKTLAASGPTAVNFFLFGDEVTTTDAFKIANKGSLSVAATVIYTATGVQALLKTLEFFNTAGTPSTIFLYANGTATTDRFFTATIPAGGTLTYGAAGWQLTDATGATVVASVSPISATGDVTGTQVGTNIALTLATFGPGPVGPIGSATQVAAVSTDAKGRVSALSAISIQTATVSQPGFMTALDKQKLDNSWIDVTANAIALVLTTNTAAQNVTAINAILAAAPAGSTIYFPGGTYNFNAAWTVPAKQFVFQGTGSGLSGGYTILAWTSVVGGDFITLQNLIWYTEFQNLTFVSSGVAQTAGAVININGNAFIKIGSCSFGGLGGGTLFNLMSGPANNASLPLSDNSWNQAVISNCVGTAYKGVAIFVNARGSSLVIENSTFNGQWGTTSQCATAGIEGRWVGALQTVACDFIGHVNNLLMDPVAANSEVCASVQLTNTYFDFSLGSCIKISGTGATVRFKADTCTFTTSNAGTGFAAVELAGSFVYPAGGQDLAFVNCNLYNTFGTTGATTGVLITNAADVSFTNCKVAGWNVGYSLVAMAGNKTNVQVLGGTVGPSGGFGLNTTGFLIAAGAYKGIQLRSVNAIGNTANLNLGAVTVLAGEGSLFAITDCAGINPRGSVGVIAVPASTAVSTNTTGFRVNVMLKAGSTAPTALTVNGVASVLPLLNQLAPIVLDPGGTIQMTYAVAPTWTWIAN